MIGLFFKAVGFCGLWAIASLLYFGIKDLLGYTKGDNEIRFESIWEFESLIIGFVLTLIYLEWH